MDRKNIKRKYSRGLADASAPHPKPKADSQPSPPVQTRNAPPSPQRPSSSPPPQSDGAYPYELHQDFNRILSEAHTCVKGVIDRKSESAQPSQPSPAKDAVPSEPSLPSRIILSPAFKRWLIRIGLLAALFFMLCSAWRDFFNDAQSSESVCEDILTRIAPEREDYGMTRSYVDYIINKGLAVGVEALDGKWASDAPPCFKVDAQRRLELLGAGHSLGEVFGDKGYIYMVECHPAIDPGATLFFEIVKENVGEKRLFRLLRIH